MFNEFINKKVDVVVTTRGNSTYECRGVLTKEDGYILTLTDVRIGVPVAEAFKNNNFVNGSMQVYKERVEKIIINKEYVVFISLAE